MIKLKKQINTEIIFIEQYLIIIDIEKKFIGNSKKKFLHTFSIIPKNICSNRDKDIKSDDNMDELIKIQKKIEYIIEYAKKLHLMENRQVTCIYFYCMYLFNTLYNLKKCMININYINQHYLKIEEL